MSRFMQVYESPIMEAYNEVVGSPVTEGFLSDIWEKIKTFLSKIWNKLTTITKSFFGALKTTFSKLSAKISKWLASTKESYTPTTESFGPEDKIMPIHSYTRALEGVPVAVKILTNKIKQFLTSEKFVKEKCEFNEAQIPLNDPEWGLRVSENGSISSPNVNRLCSLMYKAAENEGALVDISKHYIDDFDRFMNKTGGAVLDNIKDCLDVLSNERQKVFNAKNDGEIKRLLDTAGDKTKEYNDNVKYNTNIVLGTLNWVITVINAMEKLLFDTVEKISKYIDSH